MEHQTDSEARPYVSGLSKFNAFLARYAMYLGVIGLLAIVAIVVYQVFGRYVLNQPPTWAESLALVLVLYVTPVSYTHLDVYKIQGIVKAESAKSA